jgi:hypothetical protein
MRPHECDLLSQVVLPMSYTFDIIGVSPVWNFFKHQQQVESTRDRGCAYIGSYKCTLDSFIQATDWVHEKPDWDWDAVVKEMVGFWVAQGDVIRHWKQEFQQAEADSLIVARVANVMSLRHELEHIFQQ